METSSLERPGDQVRPTSVFEHIVCGVDGSPEALEAAKQARRLAPERADVTLVSISETHLATRTGPLAAQWAKRLDEEARTALDEARQAIDEAETILLHGRAADTFVRAVADQGATLAAVGSHETSRVAGVLIGSVATRVLHEASCSVFVARAADRPWPTSIVVGIDGSDGSFAAALVAHDLATRLGSTLQLVVARGAPADDVATEALTKFGHDLTFSDEKPVPALLDSAREADLLVVGSRGVTGLRSLGSVSERVAHHATCSLLVVRGLEPNSS